jgi:type II secretory pathway pseudopilin PulG
MKSKKAFSLAEVIVAIFVVSLTTSAAFIITTMNIRAQIVGQDYTVAISLAREGIEVMRGLRDTNWLYYSGSKRDSSGDQARDHWNDGFDGTDGFGIDYDGYLAPWELTDDRDFYDRTPGLENIDDVSNYFIPIISYTGANPETKYIWKLKSIENRSGRDRFPIDSRYLVYSTSTSSDSLYIQNDDLLGAPPVGGKETKFYRVLELRYQESYDQGGNCKPEATPPPGDEDSLADEDPLGDYDGDGDDDDDGDGRIDEDPIDTDCKLNANDNIILVRSKVYWYDYQGNLLHVELDTLLTDWFRREDHS